IIGAILVNFARSLLSEQFPEIWLFFQGALFLIVVMVLPDGLVGWWRSQAINQIKKLLGIQKQAVTYPSLETDPEVQQEREDLTGK
ncbi:MAG TPA: urea ABC transporter permease subunit UrtC, partial [Phormidium sp.]